MFGLFNTLHPPLGLNISDVSLKLMQLARRESGFAVQAYSDLTIPKDAVGGDNLKNPEAIGKLIRQALQRPKFGKITTRDVVASIPEARSFVRIIQIPAMSESEAKVDGPWGAEA